MNTEHKIKSKWIMSLHNMRTGFSIQWNHTVFVRLSPSTQPSVQQTAFNYQRAKRTSLLGKVHIIHEGFQDHINYHFTCNLVIRESSFALSAWLNYARHSVKFWVTSRIKIIIPSPKQEKVTTVCQRITSVFSHSPIPTTVKMGTAATPHSLYVLIQEIYATFFCYLK